MRTIRDMNKRIMKCEECGITYEHFTRNFPKRKFCDSCVEDKKREFQRKAYKAKKGKNG